MSASRTMWALIAMATVFCGDALGEDIDESERGWFKDIKEADAVVASRNRNFFAWRIDGKWWRAGGDLTRPEAVDFSPPCDCVAISNGGTVAGVFDGNVVLVQLGGRRRVVDTGVLGERICKVELSVDEHLAAVSTDEGTITIVNLKTGERRWQKGTVIYGFPFALCPTKSGSCQRDQMDRSWYGMLTTVA